MTLVVISTFTGGWVGGRVGGGSEDWRVMLNSTQDQIKLKLKFELSLSKNTSIAAQGALAHHVQHCTACNTSAPA